MKPAENLYHILGLAIDALPKDIRKAFQRLSMKHHPDRGGDSATFAKINNAHKVLSDPERRAKYDATGETEEKDSVKLKAIDYLSRLFQKVLAEQDVDHENILDIMRNEITRSIDQHEQLIGQAEQAIAKCEKTIKRTKAKEGHILYDIQNSLIFNHRKAIQNHRDGIETLNIMTTLIEDVNYTVDVRQESSIFYVDGPFGAWGAGGGGFAPGGLRNG